MPCASAPRSLPPAPQFVDTGGLKQLFGLFMGKTKIKGLLGEPLDVCLARL